VPEPAVPELDIAAVLAALQHRGVRFVLIGGLAGVIHGSPFPTEDVDITPERSEENLARLSDALTDLAARVRTADVGDGLPFSHDAGSLGRVSVRNLTTRHGDLDISFVPSGTSGYEDLVRDASETSVFGLRVAVASLADVIRSKQAANRPKDQRVLPTLREILASRHQARQPDAQSAPDT
jgi:predicted nucleotidyltransferase